MEVCGASVRRRVPDRWHGGTKGGGGAGAGRTFCSGDRGAHRPNGRDSGVGGWGGGNGSSAGVGKDYLATGRRARGATGDGKAERAGKVVASPMRTVPTAKHFIRSVTRRCTSHSFEPRERALFLEGGLARCSGLLPRGSTHGWQALELARSTVCIALSVLVWLLYEKCRSQRGDAFSGALERYFICKHCGISTRARFAKDLHSCQRLGSDGYSKSSMMAHPYGANCTCQHYCRSQF